MKAPRYGVVLFLACLSIPAHAKTTRFALVFGNNEGGRGQARLWFAEKDAARMAKALKELGDFQPENVVLMQARGVQETREALEQLETRISSARKQGDQTFLFVYYSGHANSTGLELGREVLSYEELRSRVASSVADVRMAVVDACEAGKLTQVKGGRAAHWVDFPLPDDQAVSGTAFVSSTAIGELAQESALLQGSFFSHHFEAGLRGAADADGDKRITLNEVFRYTSSRTVSETLGTDGGAQHPTYDLRLSGKGDVFLADLRRADGRLVLPPTRGMYVIRSQKDIIADLPAHASPVVLGLPAGQYVVERRDGAMRDVATVSLASGQTVEHLQFTSAAQGISRAKGRQERVELAAGITMGTGSIQRWRTSAGASAAVRMELGAWAIRPYVSYSSTRHPGTFTPRPFGGQLTYDLMSIKAGGALFRSFQLGPLRFDLGPSLELSRETQLFAGGAQLHAYGPGLGLVLSPSFGFGRFRAGVDASAAGQFLHINDQLSLVPNMAAAVWLSYTP